MSCSLRVCGVALMSVLLMACDRAPSVSSGGISAPIETPTYAIVDVAVLPMVGPDLLTGQTVLIREGRIQRIGSSSAMEVPEGAVVIPGKGRYLMPGLADMHAHVMRDSELAVYLANGVTLIRNMWGEPSVLRLRERVNTEGLPGPRIYTAGRMIDGAVPHHFGTVAVSDGRAVEQVIRQQIDAGFDFLKIYSTLDAEVFAAIATAAGALGIEFSGHVPRAVALSVAVDSSMHSMEHLYGFLKETQRANVSGDLEWRWADEEAQAVVAAIGRGERSLASVVDAERRRALVEQAAQDGVWIVPTFSVLRMHGMHELSTLPATSRYLYPSVRRSWEESFPLLRQTSEEIAKGEAILFDDQLALVGELYRAGANLLVGTDAPNPGVVTGFAVVDEIALMERAGLPRMDALRAATLWPARYLGERGKGYGTVVEGAVADLLLLDADPLQNLDALRDIAGVFRAVGDMAEHTRWYPGEELQALLADVEAQYAALEARFQSEPAPLADESPIYSFASADGYRLVLQSASDDAGVRVGFALLDEANDDDWTLVEAQFEGGESALSVGERRYHVADAGRALLRDDTAIAHAADGAKLILTGTPADLPLIAHLAAELAVGDRIPLTAWFCPGAVDCEAAAVVAWQLERLPDSVVDGVFYHTGVRQYAVIEGDARLAVLSIGGGPFYGGQPFAVDAPAWPYADLQRVR